MILFFTIFLEAYEAFKKNIIYFLFIVDWVCSFDCLNESNLTILVPFFLLLKHSHSSMI